MKNHSRRIISTLLIAITMLGVMGAGATVAGAQSKSAANANVGRNWHYDISFGQAPARWDAKLKQSSSGSLRGTVDPPTGDCLARVVSGKVTGKSIRMTWRISGPCPLETVTVKGKVSGRHISGTVMDSIHGAGTFAATRDY
jgi:hypothetical protein